MEEGRLQRGDDRSRGTEALSWGEEEGGGEEAASGEKTGSDERRSKMDAGHLLFLGVGRNTAGVVSFRSAVHSVCEKRALS